ncbi:PREDICTED: uncharacterized protein LOC109180255 [Ipomoea nil]|uniref:uncharacterized protein LOC109180255 n=1 Tax=Ipomoea nil TaxID=35883 RepID=UPI000901154A|nr:PREDICTED: uncharacterized protein LOC109180255 [Ipomoea nil]
MGSDGSRVTRFLAELASEFKIRDMGVPSFFIGIEKVPWNDGLLLCQRRYMQDILKRANMVDYKPLVTPVSLTRPSTDVPTPYADPTQYRSLAGVLQYLTVTRPDLSYAISSVAVHGFSDSDWTGDPDDRKSTCGFAGFLGNNLISWACRKQCTVARSSTEAEYKGLADVFAEVTWLVSLLRELGVGMAVVPSLWCDNLGVTYLCANPVFHARMKHVEIDYHFVRDKMAKKELQVHSIFTKDQVADRMSSQNRYLVHSSCFFVASSM